MRSKTIPTALELIEAAISYDADYYKASSIMDVDLPCMGTELNRILRSICRNWEYDIDHSPSYPKYKYRLLRNDGGKKRSANELDIQEFCRYLLIGNPSVNIIAPDNVHKIKGVELYLTLVSNPLVVRPIHFELGFDGYLTLHTHNE